MPLSTGPVLRCQENHRASELLDASTLPLTDRRKRRVVLQQGWLPWPHAGIIVKFDLPATQPAYDAPAMAFCKFAHLVF